MTNRYIDAGVDEFNYLYMYCIDAIKWRQTHPESKLYTFCFDRFDVLFNEFDYIFSSQLHDIKPETDMMELFSSTTIQQDIRKEKLPKLFEKYDLREITWDTLNNDIRHNEHVYKYVFGNTTRNILQGTQKYICPKKADYYKVLHIVSTIRDIVANSFKDRKLVVINGRNLKKIPGRNNLFEPLIDYLVKEGFIVINLTVEFPCLIEKSQYDLNYQEVKNNNLSYSYKAAWFNAADAVISVANAGAINIHLLTEGNFIMLGEGGWVDNPEFGDNGNSLIAARRKMRPNLVTEHLPEYTFEQVVALIEKCSSNKNYDSFFDEKKIIHV